MLSNGGFSAWINFQPCELLLVNLVDNGYLHDIKLLGLGYWLIVWFWIGLKQLMNSQLIQFDYQVILSYGYGVI